MANLIKLDAEYFLERAGKLKGAADPAAQAMNLMKNARMSSGLLFAQRQRINAEIDAIRNEVAKTAQGANRLVSALGTGSNLISNWERSTQSREKSLASRLSKTWGFEASNWFGGENQMVPVTPIPPDTPDAQNNSGIAGQNMASDYYTREITGVDRILKNGRMNCVYYARARAMEANGLETYSSAGTGNSIQANSIARFPGHDVFIEHVELDANGQPSTVVFSESNWTGQAEGHQSTMSYAAFIARNGGAQPSYVYF